MFAKEDAFLRNLSERVKKRLSYAYLGKKLGCERGG